MTAKTDTKMAMMASTAREVKNLSEMKALAEEIAASCGSRTLLLLDGPMASGKTQFTKFLVEALGGEDTRSPSFAIHHSYAVTRGSVEHFDLFRLQSEDDLESTGFWDFFRSAEGVIVIEWQERLREMKLDRFLPVTWPRIQIEIAHAKDQPAESERRRVVITRSSPS